MPPPRPLSHVQIHHTAQSLEMSKHLTVPAEDVHHCCQSIHCPRPLLDQTLPDQTAHVGEQPTCAAGTGSGPTNLTIQKAQQEIRCNASDNHTCGSV